MSEFFTNKLSSLEPYIPGEQPTGKDSFIKLNTNENPFPPSKKVKAAVSGKEVDNLRLYSDPTCSDFLEALAKTFGVQKENVFASNGSDEVLAFSFMAFCEKGAAYADITYGFYKVFAALLSVEATVVPLDDELKIKVDDYKNIDKTVFIANPNAPTGIALSADEVERLIKQNQKRLVVVDEAYVDFGGESVIPLTKRYKNLLVIGTFSKSRNLAGARLGFAVANEELIKDLNTVKFSFNPYNVNRLTLVAGAAALSDEKYFCDNLKKVVDVREYAKQELSKLGFVSTDSKTNFIFTKCPDGLSGEEYYKKLKRRGILVRYLGGKRIEKYVRISIGTKKDMDALIAATKEILKGEGK